MTTGATASATTGTTTGTTTIALLHPGEMGAAVGAALRSNGHEVCWVADSRSEATHSRAAAAGLEQCAVLEDVLGVDVIVSVVPPGRAVEVGTTVVDAGFGGLYLDANAIAPGTAADLAARCAAGPAARPAFVDGGIVGPPPRSAGSTRLALSGERAREVADLFEGSHLEPVIVGAEPGAASAFKVGFASWTKGTAALALVIDAFVDAHGLGDELRHEWERRGMDIDRRISGAATGSVPKAWRFDDEMREIAAALADVGLPPGWFEAAAESYERLGGFKDRFDDPPPLDEVRRRLRGDSM